MPICVLFIRGKDFDVDNYLKTSPFKNSAKVFRKGDTSVLKNRPPLESSGFGISIEDSDDSLALFFIKTEFFLRDNIAELKLLSASYEVEELELSMGFYWGAETACLSIELPTAILSFIGESRMTVTINVFAVSEHD
jgi:hypothetical protein